MQPSYCNGESTVWCGFCAGLCGVYVDIGHRFEWLAITKDTRHILGWVCKLPAKFGMHTKMLSDSSLNFRCWVRRLPIGVRCVVVMVMVIIHIQFFHKVVNPLAVCTVRHGGLGIGQWTRRASTAIVTVKPEVDVCPSPILGATCTWAFVLHIHWSPAN